MIPNFVRRPRKSARASSRRSAPKKSVLLQLEPLEDRTLLASAGIIATGPEVGQQPLVRVYDALTQQEKFNFLAYNQLFHGGVRLAVWDMNRDGTPDIITGTGPGGGSLVGVFDGRDGSPLAGPLASFQAYGAGFSGAISVAAGDVNGDGYADVITGPDTGGQPRVKVFSGHDGAVLADFLAYSSWFHGGVRVAAADVNGDHKADIIAAPGPGSVNEVRVFDGGTLQELERFQPYDWTFHGGVYVAAWDLNGDHLADIVTGPGQGNHPLVRVFDGANGSSLGQFLAYAPTFHGGVRVAIADADGDHEADIFTAPGAGSQREARAFDGQSFVQLGAFTPYGSQGSAGFFIGGDDPLPTVWLDVENAQAYEDDPDGPAQFQIDRSSP